MTTKKQKLLPLPPTGLTAEEEDRYAEIDKRMALMDMPDHGPASLMLDLCRLVKKHAVDVADMFPRLKRMFDDVPLPDSVEIEKARLLSLLQGTITVVTTCKDDPTDECFTCGIGMWNITKMTAFLASVQPTFGPFQFPVHKAMYDYMAAGHYDPDPALAGTFTPEKLQRPCVLWISDKGYFLIDGTNRFMEAYKMGYTHLPMYLVPDALSRAFQTWIFEDGKEVDHVAMNIEMRGMYTRRMKEEK